MSVRVGRRRWSRRAPRAATAPSNAAFEGASADGTRVFFETVESLVSADTDTSMDVYERAGGQTTLVSTGPTGGNGTFDASFAGASADGSRVFFETEESLVSADTDTAQDVYERAGGQTTLLSTGPTGGNGAFQASFGGASADGTRVFFQTEESLVSADTDTFDDVYVKRIPAPANTARPTISGTPLVGRRLTCSPGTMGQQPDDASPTGGTAVARRSSAPPPHLHPRRRRRRPADHLHGDRLQRRRQPLGDERVGDRQVPRGVRQHPDRRRRS